MNELFLFVRPPRPLWPFNSSASAFWPPLAFASLAAALRAQIPGLRVGILDAPALEMGWRTLETEIRRRQPAYIGIGEEAVSCVEGFRLAAIAQACGAWVIAGGCFFGHVAPQALGTGLIDIVVHGEGEVTVVELVEALRVDGLEALRQIPGLSFTVGEEIVTTPPRQPIPNLDTLPMPAYDLLPVESYGAGSRNHPQLAAIELGRGCIGSCGFCVLWRQMGRFVGRHSVPFFRVKSPERALEEIQLLVRRYHRRYLGWVDPCFNAHPQVPGRLAELLLRADLHVGQSAWIRTDAVVRDAASGALGMCVQAGLNEVYLGIERSAPESLTSLEKSTSVAQAREAMRLLRSQFPSVLAIGSFIYGLPGDTPETVRDMHLLAFELQLDQFFFIPFTPLPGTVGWRSEFWDATGQRFRKFNFLPGSDLHPHQAALERALLLSLLFQWLTPAKRIRTWRHQLCAGDARKRRVLWRLFWRDIQFHCRQLAHKIFAGKYTDGLIFPAWYES